MSVKKITPAIGMVGQVIQEAGDFHMSKRQYIVYILKQLLHRSFNPQPEDMFILVILYFCVGCIVVFAFAFILSSLDFFAWLMYGAMSVGVIIEVLTIIWRVQYIIKQNKGKEQNNTL